MNLMTEKPEDMLDFLNGIQRVEMIPKADGRQTDLTRRVPKYLPKELLGKNFELKTAKTSSQLNIFYAKPGVLSSIFNHPKKKGVSGWTKKDFEYKGLTNKKFLKELTHNKTGQKFIAVPVTSNHFREDSIKDYHFGEGHILIPKDVLLENPAWNVSLNHEQIPVVKKNNRWEIDPKSHLANLVDFKGSISASNPQEIYLLNKEELAEYEKKGSRNAWESAPMITPVNGTKVFIKKTENSAGQQEVTEKRYAKPVEINGEQMFILSNKENMDKITIKKMTQHNSSKQESAPKETVQHDEYENKTIPTADTLTGVLKNAFERIKIHQEFANPESQKSLKVEYEKIKTWIEKHGAETDPEGSKKLQNELQYQIKSNPALTRAGKVLASLTVDYLRNNSSSKKEKKDVEKPYGLDQRIPENNDNASEAIAGNVAGAVAGTVAGTIAGGANLLGAALKGTGEGVAALVRMHYARKKERLDNPGLVEKEEEQKKANCDLWRKNNANISNAKMAGYMESGLQSLAAIQAHPGVQKINAMVEDDPARLEEAQDLMKYLSNEDPIIKQHHKNLLKQTKRVTSSMQDNLELNQLAGSDLEEEKAKIESFHKKMSDNPLADILLDEEDSMTLRETLAKMASQLAKFIKEMIMQFRSGRSDENPDSPATTATM